jgi:hypothetical protein
VALPRKFPVSDAQKVSVSFASSLYGRCPNQDIGLVQVVEETGDLKWGGLQLMWLNQ